MAGATVSRLTVEAASSSREVAVTPATGCFIVVIAIPAESRPAFELVATTASGRAELLSYRP